VNVGVLASGEGTNLQALLDTVHGRDAQIVAVGSDQASARALERARAAGVDARVFLRSEYADRAMRDAAIADWLDERGVELVVLAGYMALLDAAFVRRFEDRMINVHPSLLPAFPGVRAIEQALDHGVKVFGVTVHFVDEGIDTGPIILQRAIELPDARDPTEVLARLRPLEHDLLPRAVALFAAGRVRRDPTHPRRVLVDEQGAATPSPPASPAGSQ
jgi:phosphoribosylglycinamide formyltransferase 1